MNPQTGQRASSDDPNLIQQIDKWRARKSESENVEFKEARNSYDYQQLCEYCIAISNERGGVLLLGVGDKRNPSDGLRPVVGTAAFSKPTKIARQLFERLKFRIDVQEVNHPGGRVLIFRIPSRPLGEARHLDGRYLMRVGDSLVAGTPEWLNTVNSEKNSRGGSRRAVVIGPIVVVLLAGAWLALKERTPPDPYSFSLDFLITAQDHRSLNAFWWLGFPKVGTNHSVVYPANVVMLLSITNERSFPVLIKRYQIEMKTNRDTFVPLVHLSTIGTSVYLGDSRTSLSPLLDPTPFLDRVINQHPLGPHESVRGYALFQFPKDDGARFSRQFKITIEDYSNLVYTSRVFETQQGEMAQASMISAGEAVKTFSEASVEFEPDKIQ